MEDKNNLISSYLKEELEKKNISSKQMQDDLEVSQQYVSAILNGKKSIGKKMASKLATLYNLNEIFLITGILDSGLSIKDETQKVFEKITLENKIIYPDDLKSLGSKLKSLVSKRNPKSSGEGSIVNENDLVEASQYVVPIKGQAGLNKAFFYPDEYIEEHFEKEVILVKPADRGSFLKIEVDGNSMPGVLDPGDWARCEEIPKIHWMDKNIFKPKKVYCLFHNKRGILFKRISKTQNDIIILSSDNMDKIEYPDEEFNLIEFSKILTVRKVEKEL